MANELLNKLVIDDVISFITHRTLLCAISFNTNGSVI